MEIYTITDWLGLVPVFFGMGIAVLGLVQWIKRKSILKVDYDILTLGGFYIVVIAIYLVFEMLVINYRPVLINGALEVSYPSSTTMLVMFIMPTSIMQFNARIKSGMLKRCLTIIIIAFIVFMVGGRLVSGVHWLSDIIGGAILSAGLVLMYGSVSGLNKK
jgi:undecaprenyl-diphosphatase